MDLGSIFLIIALLTLVGLFISRPIYERNQSGATAPAETGATARADQKRSALLAERDRVLTALAELDFDYTVGKVPEEDYPIQRSALLEHGVRILRELDAQEESKATREAAGEAETAPAATPEDRLEAAIAARRLATTQAAGPAPNGGAASVGGPAPAGDDDIEIQIAARRRLRQEKAAGFCPQCGGPVQKSDRFCPKCGASQK
jgi:hypothetical protein